MSPETPPFQREQALDDSAAGLENRSVDIRDLMTDAGREQHEVLAREVLTIQGQSVEVGLGPIAYYPEPNAFDPKDSGGVRVTIATYLSSDGGVRLLEHVRAPLAYQAGPDFTLPNGIVVSDRERRWGRERRTNAALSHHATGRVITPLPHADTSQDILYESNAPGVRLDRVLINIQFARTNNWITDAEASLMLGGLYLSAEEALQALNDEGIQHNHPHMGNFNVDIRSAQATIFDYTDAESKRDQHQPYWDQLTPDAKQGFLELDNMHFREYWQDVVTECNLTDIPSVPGPDYVQADATTALARLDIIFTRTQLYKLGIIKASEDDARAVLDAQDRLIASADMPDIAYPTDPPANPPA